MRHCLKFTQAASVFDWYYCCFKTFQRFYLVHNLINSGISTDLILSVNLLSVPFVSFLQYLKHICNLNRVLCVEQCDVLRLGYAGLYH